MRPNPFQNLHRLLRRRLIHDHRLKTAFQRRILFDIFPVFIQCRRADNLNLSLGKRRLQNVRSIHRVLRISRANQVMNLINDENNIPILNHFIDDSLHAAFKLSPKLCSGHKSRHIQESDFLMQKLHRHLTPGNPQR